MYQEVKEFFKIFQILYSISKKIPGSIRNSTSIHGFIEFLDIKCLINKIFSEVEKSPN